MGGWVAGWVAGEVEIKAILASNWVEVEVDAERGIIWLWGIYLWSDKIIKDVGTIENNKCYLRIGSLKTSTRETLRFVW